jgi:hypothetical protein
MDDRRRAFIGEPEDRTSLRQFKMANSGFGLFQSAEAHLQPFICDGHRPATGHNEEQANFAVEGSSALAESL